jgi:hypothetical protein
MDFIEFFVYKMVLHTKKIFFLKTPYIICNIDETKQQKLSNNIVT